MLYVWFLLTVNVFLIYIGFSPLNVLKIMITSVLILLISECPVVILPLCLVPFNCKCVSCVHWIFTIECFENHDNERPNSALFIICLIPFNCKYVSHVHWIFIIECFENHDNERPNSANFRVSGCNITVTFGSF